MTTAVQPHLALKTILFTTDFTDASRHALPFAGALAHHYGSRLLLAHVIEQVPMSSVPMDVMPPDIERDEERVAKRMSEFMRTDDLRGIETKTVIEPGFLWPSVAEILEKEKVDMLVVGTHGRGAVARLLLGSAAEEIFRHASCPVLTIGPHVDLSKANFEKVNKILFATDFSAGSALGLEYALQLVTEHDAQLLMIHVVQTSAVPFDVTDEFVANSEAKLKDMIPRERMPATPPLFLTLIGVPSEQVLNFAEREDADLIVIGMHKGTGLAPHWPNEFAAKVMAEATCPVLSVRR